VQAGVGNKRVIVQFNKKKKKKEKRKKIGKKCCYQQQAFITRCGIVWTFSRGSSRRRSSASQGSIDVASTMLELEHVVRSNLKDRTAVSRSKRKLARHFALRSTFSLKRQPYIGDSYFPFAFTEVADKYLASSRSRSKGE